MTETWDDDWLPHFLAWAYGEEDSLDFRGKKVPRRVRFILEDGWAWRDERGVNLND